MLSRGGVNRRAEDRRKGEKKGGVKLSGTAGGGDRRADETEKSGSG